MYWIRQAKPDFGVHGQSRPLTKELLMCNFKEKFSII